MQRIEDRRIATVVERSIARHEEQLAAERARLATETDADEVERTKIVIDEIEVAIISRKLALVELVCE